MNTKKYEELLVLLRSHKTDKEILEVLSDYHENDIADMLAGMNEEGAQTSLQAPWNTSGQRRFLHILMSRRPILMSCLWSRLPG